MKAWLLVLSVITLSVMLSPSGSLLPGGKTAEPVALCDSTFSQPVSVSDSNDDSSASGDDDSVVFTLPATLIDRLSVPRHQYQAPLMVVSHSLTIPIRAPPPRV